MCVVWEKSVCDVVRKMCMREDVWCVMREGVWCVHCAAKVNLV